MKFEDMKINCHSSICLNGNIYIDPFNVQDSLNNAKVVFITHPHFDHLDVPSIRKVSNDKTIFVCTKDSAEKLSTFENEKIIVKPNEKGKANGVEFSTFPAYNFGHHHFKEYGWVGYIIKINGVSYTICGDTDRTPELESVKTDVLFVPIGGTYTMDAKEAGKLVNIIKPSLAIPTHYNYISGTCGREGEREFKAVVDKKIPIKILVK